MVTSALTAQHRQIESALDTVAENIAHSRIDWPSFLLAHRLLRQHYADEEEFLARLAACDAALARKLTGQHEEALEIAAHLENVAPEAAPTRDTLYLLRRFLAIVQHNIIEEERDVFPLRLDDAL